MIMKTGRKLLRRLRGRAGESIAEVLVALLISALAMMLLAGMINSSWKVLDSSRAALADYNAQESVLTAQGSSDRTGTVTASLGGDAVKLNADTNVQIPVKYYVNDAVGGKPVVAYKAG